MKCIYTTALNVINQYDNSANLWTLVNNDFDSIIGGGAFQVEIEQVATGYREGASDVTVSVDSDKIIEVAPDYLPYMEEGCNIALITSSSSDSDRNAIIGSLQDECSDFEYYKFNYGSGQSAVFGLIAKGVANATQTQFYQPKLTASSNADIKAVVLWEDE